VGWKETPYRDTFAPGIAVPGSVTTSIPADFPPGQYWATGHTETATFDGDITNNTDQAVVAVQAVSDTNVVKTLAATPVKAGQTASYRLTATNAGPSTAHDVTVSDSVPERTKFNAASVQGGECSLRDDPTKGQVVACHIATMAPGTSAEVTIAFDVEREYVGELCNQTLVGSGSLDPESEDNTSKVCTDVIPVPRADVGITMTAVGPPAPSGSPASVEAVIHNYGPDGATAVRAIFTIPPQLTNYSGELTASTPGTSPAAKCEVGPEAGKLTCVIGDIPMGGSATYRITGVTTGDASPIHVTGTITHVEDIDNNPDNDNAAADIALEAPSHLPSSSAPAPPPSVSPEPTRSPGKPTKSAKPSHSAKGGGGRLPDMGTRSAMPLTLLGLLALTLGGTAVAASKRTRREE
jgi:uncharacterized repeat protein (TIGR01451 family)